MHYEEALQHCIFQFTSGSHQYGTSRPDSDVDKRGVFIAPIRTAFDIFQSNFVCAGTLGQELKAAKEALENGDLTAVQNHLDAAMKTDRGDLSLAVETVRHTENDEELQELRKFMKLAADSNPNIIEFLYVEHFIHHLSPEWELIREHRDLFLSKKARYTFAGYAIAQLRKIRMHRGYLLNPPDHKPTRSEFGLKENSKIAKENQNALLSIPEEWIVEHARDQVLQEKRYSSALDAWNSYQKWGKERNPARREMERAYGYDVKHSCHLVRLCRMAVEILRDGVVLVRRPDAEELKGILRGEWTYEQIEAVAANIDKELDVLYTESTLRNSPDRAKIADLYREICEKRYAAKLS